MTKNVNFPVGGFSSVRGFFADPGETTCFHFYISFPTASSSLRFRIRRKSAFTVQFFFLNLILELIAWICCDLGFHLGVKNVQIIEAVGFQTGE